MYLVYFIIPKIQVFNRAHVTKQQALLISLYQTGTPAEVPGLSESCLGLLKCWAGEGSYLCTRKCGTAFTRLSTKGFCCLLSYTVKAGVVYLPLGMSIPS